jgi:hypothetical protein
MTESSEDRQDANRPNQGRFQMVLIFAIALVSLGGSYALFYWTKSTGGWETTNRGEFVVPSTTAASLGWRNAAGGEMALEHWWVWQVVAGCGEDCQGVNKNLVSLHTLLNKEAKRVRIGFTDLTGVPMSDGLVGQAIRIETVDLEPGVYIVDPLGNLVFYYVASVDPAFILADLKRLLKVSQIG